MQQTREPRHAALDRRQVTICKSLLYGYVFCYSEPVWQRPDGIAKTHIAQKKSKQPVVGIMFVSRMQFIFSYGLIWSPLLDHKGC